MLWGAGNWGAKDCWCSKCPAKRAKRFPSIFWDTSSDDRENKGSFELTANRTSFTLYKDR
jgi:hypothetical protein